MELLLGCCEDVLSYGFIAVILTLLYFRLREITEGRTMEFTEDAVQ